MTTTKSVPFTIDYVKNLMTILYQNISIANLDIYQVKNIHFLLLTELATLMVNNYKSFRLFPF